MAMAAKKAESGWGEKVVERGNEGDGKIGSEAGVVERRATPMLSRQVGIGMV